MLKRLREGIARTRTSLANGLKSVFSGGSALDEAHIEDLEAVLLGADVGVAATSAIIERARKTGGDNALAVVQDTMLEILAPTSGGAWPPADSARPYVVLVVGVNGVGKTTSIGKLAAWLHGHGMNVMLAAGDTFRAAAVEQLTSWGERLQIPVIAQQTGADSASVIFDAYQSARARGVDVLLADTAGRLHTKDNLMDELAKVKRVLAKIDGEAPHETLLVIDATTGQNAINQATTFNDAVGLDSLVLTKLDGTAKGGVVFALAERLGLPLRFIGIGEGIEDLRPFSADEFVAALFDASAAEESALPP
ncbi:MAG: signal recognition particle-docking protein FtsY [Gammaproteobacteria bacterium]|nr:signal recognition particle-docking protein FtsY [Gammaproteobacteria bacterium]